MKATLAAAVLVAVLPAWADCPKGQHAYQSNGMWLCVPDCPPCARPKARKPPAPKPAAPTVKCPDPCPPLDVDLLAAKVAAKVPECPPQSDCILRCSDVPPVEPACPPGHTCQPDKPSYVNANSGWYTPIAVGIQQGQDVRLRWKQSRDPSIDIHEGRSWLVQAGAGYRWPSGWAVAVLAQRTFAGRLDADWQERPHYPRATFVREDGDNGRWSGLIQLEIPW